MRSALKRLCRLLTSASICAAFATAIHAHPHATDPTPSPAVTRETRVYVPFEKLEEIFKGQEQGVFLPYKEFLEMWNKLDIPAKVQEIKPPVDGVLASGDYTGIVENQVIRLGAKLDFEALKEGWTRVKLGGGSMPVADAKVAPEDPKNVGVLRASGEGHELLMSGKGRYRVEANFYGRVERTAAGASAKIHLPETAASKFELTIPERNLEFTITPACAFTTVDNEAEGTTRLAVYFEKSQAVQIRWRQKLVEGKLEPLLFAQTMLTSRLKPGSARHDFGVDYRILRAGVSQFELEVPRETQVLSVEGESLKEWVVAEGGETQRVRVSLHTPAQQSYSLLVTMETPIGNLPATLPIPKVKVIGAARQTGMVQIGVSPELLVERSDLLELTQAPLPAAKENVVSQGTPLVAAYRYLRTPYGGTLQIREATPQIEATSVALLVIQPDSARFDAEVQLQVRRAGIFFLDFEVPAGFGMLEAKGAAVEDSTVREEGGRKLVRVQFKERVSGNVTLKLHGETARTQPVAAATVAVVAPLGVERHEGRVAVAVHTSLKANTSKRGDLRGEDARTVRELTPQDPKATPVQLAFRYRDRAQPAELQFELQKARVSVEMLTALAIRESAVQHQWKARYYVEYTGVNEFQIELPKVVGDDVQIEGNGIKERVKVPATGEGAAERVAWRITTQERILGLFELTFSHEVSRKEEAAGALSSVTLMLPRAGNVFRETGQVVVTKAGNLELSNVQATQLDPIDPREADLWLRRPAAFLAYRYARWPVSLSVGVTRNQFVKTPEAIINHAVLTSALSEDGAETTEVIYWVRNAGLQFFTVKLPTRGGNQAKLLTQITVGTSVQPASKRKDAEELLIRLPAGQREDTNAFLVRFVYELPSSAPGTSLPWSGTFSLTPPEVEGVKTMQTSWDVYAPENGRYTSVQGSMNEVLRVSTWERLRGLVALPLGMSPLSFGELAVEPPPKVPAGVVAGFDAPVPQKGFRIRLSRTDEPAPAVIEFRSRTFNAFVELAFGLAGLIPGLLRLMRPALIRGIYFVVAGLGSLAVAMMVNGRTSFEWQCAFLGVLAAAGVWVAVWVISIPRRILESRRVSSRQPPVVPKPPVPPVSPEGPVEAAVGEESVKPAEPKQGDTDPKQP